MKKILAIALCLGGFSAFAEDLTIPASPARYTIATSRGAKCERYDSVCVTNLRNKTVDDAMIASFNYCNSNFGTQVTVVDWKAECSSPEITGIASCFAHVDFTCGL